jgi:hypothetical protein
VREKRENERERETTKVARADTRWTFGVAFLSFVHLTPTNSCCGMAHRNVWSAKELDEKEKERESRGI